MAWYCVQCRNEIPTGEEVRLLEDGTVSPLAAPRHADCVPGYVAPERKPESVRTEVVDLGGRLVCRGLDPEGQVESWLELPSSLKQPFMAMVADVTRRSNRAEFPVPGGDKLVVRRVTEGGLLTGVQLSREPVGFPNEGRDLRVNAGDLELFIVQCRSV
ncbi:MAG: hypothetical protein ACOYM9_10390 [Bradymonadia bacterium]